ncbi:MAG TPA: class I tRNA ligase family protein, partial [Steroidobacteraceae bacterium]|nr:class I tRNA ligase family protein [Steroidobacteraceae bacterium]
FITEEIWQRLSPLLGRAGPTIMLAPWPEAAQWPPDAAAEAEMQWLTRVVLGVRQIRGEMDISPARRLPLLMQQHSAEDLRRAGTHATLLMRLAGLESVQPLAPGERAPPAAAALVGELTLLVPMAGLIDPAAEAERLTRRIDKTRQEIARARAKLGNDNFVRGAPGEDVAQERERLSGFETALGGLQRQLEQVRALERP